MELSLWSGHFLYIIPLQLTSSARVRTHTHLTESSSLNFLELIWEPGKQHKGVSCGAFHIPRTTTALAPRLCSEAAFQRLSRGRRSPDFVFSYRWCCTLWLSKFTPGKAFYSRHPKSVLITRLWRDTLGYPSNGMGCWNRATQRCHGQNVEQKKTGGV